MAHFQDPTIQTIYEGLKNNYPNSSSNFAILKIAIDDDILRNEYQTRCDENNKKFATNVFMDSGFDLILPSPVTFDKEIETKFIDMKIKAEMLYCDLTCDKVINTGFYVYPRSSISKTPLMLANHTGIIDSGYRGSLIGAFRCLDLSNTVDGKYMVDQYTRLVQVCHPTLCPIYTIVVDSNTISSSERGSGGFGSTGL
jgi:dUTP pyrophosphatase